MVAVNMKPKDMATAAGMSRTALNDRLQGRTRISLDDLDRFAAIFGVTPVDLINGPGEWLNHITPHNASTHPAEDQIAV